MWYAALYSVLCAMLYGAMLCRATLCNAGRPPLASASWACRRVRMRASPGEHRGWLPKVLPLPLEKKTSEACSLFPLGVVVRFRAVFTTNIAPKALRTTTSEVVLLLGQKKLGAHAVVVFWVARGDSTRPTGRPEGSTWAELCLYVVVVYCCFVIVFV